MSDGSAHLDLLRNTFPDLSEDELRALAGETVERKYPSGVVLCHEGAYEDIFYILASGQARITVRGTVDEAQEERELRVLGPGEYFGEMGLIQDFPRAASVTTLTEVTVLEMDKAEFETALRRSPTMAVNLIHTTLDRMRSNDQLVIQELRRINDTLTKLDQNKLGFIQIAAHELRTPLTVISGYADLLRTHPSLNADPTLQEVIAGISSGSERMHRVVNSMLDVSRLASDTLSIAPAPVALRHVVSALLTYHKPDIEARSMHIVEEHAPNLPLVNADPTLVEKAVDHLLVNAIKYTPDGGTITIRTRQVSMDDGRPGIELSITDTGIGLSADDLGLIFEKFYQVGTVELHSSGKTSFKGGGPGVGLAIARGVANAHGGKLWAESEGHDESRMPGSTFFLHLPVDPLQAARKPNSA
ncbi:MAG: ATP-binding protein [Anaerolineales bacterium]